MADFRIHFGLKIFNLKEAPSLVEQAARLMTSEWPRQGVSSRMNRITDDLRSNNGFPLHVVITTACIPINNDNKKSDASYLYVIGHGKISQAHQFKQMHGATAIVYDVVIDRKFRGYGLGQKLLQKLETIAFGLDITHLYLSTHSAIEFYKKLGYKIKPFESPRPSNLRENAKRLTYDQAHALEKMMAQKAKMYRSDNKRFRIQNHDDEKHEDGDEDGGQHRRSNVWFSKRLTRLMRPKWFDSAHEANRALRPYICDASEFQFEGYCLLLPFIEQVGPCCAFAAMANIEFFSRCVKHVEREDCGSDGVHLLSVASAQLHEEEETLFAGLQSRCLLHECMKTEVCLDGEMYNVDTLFDVLRNGFSTSETKWQFELMPCTPRNCRRFIDGMHSRLKQQKRAMEVMEFLIFPYDKHGGNAPIKVEEHTTDCDDDAAIANSAHYCVVVGGFYRRQKTLIRENVCNLDTVNKITDLMEMIDRHVNDDDDDRSPLDLVYLSPSQKYMTTMDSNELIHANHCLQHQKIPQWIRNQTMNLSGQMIKVVVNV